jgi:hypothetical protein
VFPPIWVGDVHPEFVLDLLTELESRQPEAAESISHIPTEETYYTVVVTRCNDGGVSITLKSYWL